MLEQEHLQSKQVGAKRALERSQKNLSDKLAAKGLKLPLYPTPQIIDRARAVMGSIDFDPTKTRSRLIKLTGSSDQAGLDNIGAASISTPLTITYYPGRAQATPKSGSTVHNFLKLELEYFGTSMNKSICLSRIAGFSLLNNIDNQCSNVF